MKTAYFVAAVAALLAGTPAFAAKVSSSYQNLGTTTMTVSKISACASFSPTPVAVPAGQTSAVSVATCNEYAAASHVTYKMDSKQCVFHISVTYTPGNPILGTTGYYTPQSSADASGGAICKVTNKDISGIYQGNSKATFTMK